MNNGIKSLFPSLVGSSIEYSFKKKLASVTPIEQNIRSAKRRIERDVEMALAVGGELCVMLLAELTSYYSKETYYMAVRSSIEMRRFRPRVLEYMALSVDERAERLQKVLSEPIRKDKNREIKVEALRYFLSTYVGRINEFKKLLTREEFLIVV